MPFWKSLFSGRRRRENYYQPVTNYQEDGAEDIDELLRLASEGDPSLFPEENEMEGDERAVFSSSSSSLQWRQPARQRVCRLTCECGVPTTGEKMSVYLLCLSLLTILIVAGVSVGLGYYSMLVLKPEPVIDKSIDAFSIPNHEAYIRFDALNLARKYNSSHMRFRRDTTDEEALHVQQEADSLPWMGEQNGARVKRSENLRVQRYTNQIVKRWKMQVIYLAVGDEGHNIFTEERLKMIHKIERDIVSHPRWREFCLRDPHTASFDPAVRDHNDCAPLNSLLSYFFPSKDDSGRVFYDGFGENLGDIDSALHLAMNHESFYYFVDSKINRTYQKSHMLRTEVLFGAPLPGYRSLVDHSEAQSDKFKEFVVTYINMLSKASTDKVHVLYGGNELFDYEVESTFWNDVRLAIIAGICIAVLMFIMTSFSIFLTIMGLLCILLSFPIAIFFYRVVFNIVGLGIMNGAAAFVIIGIGVDDVFVFINIFRQSTHLKSVTHRLKYTCRTAGVATFFTSFTTAIAFASNMASSIPAVYTFGLFMSLIVAGCWISVFLIMPATLYLYAFWFEPLEHMCAGICCHCIPAAEPLDGGVDQNIAESRMTMNSPSVVLDDGDVPMLQLELDPVEEDGDDVALLVPDRSVESGQLSSSSIMGRLQQDVLKAFVKRLVIRFRIPVIVLYGLIFIASVGMMSQLRPAAHPPQLFLPDTNLQQLLDLKANFTMIDTLHCDRCSALYNVGSEDTHRTPKPAVPRKTPAPPTTTPRAPTTRSVPTASPTTPRAPTTGSIPTSITRGGLSTHHPQPFPLTTAPGRTVAPASISKSDTATTTSTSTTTTAASTTTSATATTATTLTTTTTTTTTTTVRPVHEPANALPSVPTSRPQAGSVGAGYDPCKHQNCNNIKNRPIMQSDATVYVVFGISGIDSSGVSQEGHVLNQYKGRATFDDRFANEVGNLHKLNLDRLRELCRVCHILANNADLVKNGSAQCLPRHLPYALTHILNGINECKNLPKTLTIYNHEAPSHAEASVNQDGKIIWLAFAFESTVSKGQSYFEAYKKYLAWEKFIAHIKSDVLSKDSPLSSMYQTSEFWKKVLMEVVAVNSAVYSVVLSLVVCMCSVAIFTGHVAMLLIVTFTIVALIGLVVAIFFMVGWHMGAVEAVSLSILVGSSVDYCVHLVEGYLLMGKAMPSHIATAKKSEVRKWRASSAVHHIGASIISSAVTTIVAAIPLTQTTIQPFSKFGEIVLINSSVSIFYTLTMCVALLATIAPARFVPTYKSHLLAFVVTGGVCGLVVLAMYVASVSGIFIPGPNGGPLFP